MNTFDDVLKDCIERLMIIILYSEIEDDPIMFYRYDSCTQASGYSLYNSKGEGRNSFRHMWE